MEKIKQLLTEAESIAIKELQAQTDSKTPSPHAAVLRARIHVALESLEAHVAHLALNKPQTPDAKR